MLHWEHFYPFLKCQYLLYTRYIHLQLRLPIGNIQAFRTIDTLPHYDKLKQFMMSKHAC